MMKCKLFSIFFLLFAPFSGVAQDNHRFFFNENNPDVHDPVMARGEDGRYYVFSTGMGIGVMSSADMKTWRRERPVFDHAPEWAVDSVKGFRGHIWAPDISRHGDKWYLYYSCSTFGKNGSAIGVATNSTLDPQSPHYKWEDQGVVIVSHKRQDNWNAIDPALVPNSESPLLTYGSFWDGIQIVDLANDLKTKTTVPKTIARRIGRKLSLAEMNDSTAFTIEGNDTIEAGENAIEAPFVIHRDGWYYLLVSWDYCCRGRNSTYKTVYGRSRSARGPYLDKEGKDMAHGGGTYLAGPCEEFFGIGHCSAYEFDGQWYFVSHAYDVKENGRAKLFIRKMQFDKDGWIEIEK